MFGDRKRAVSDTAGLILIAGSGYFAFQPSGSIYTSAALFVSGLMSLALSRRTHRCSAIAGMSRHLAAYAPTLVVLIFVAGAVSDFGRHLTRVDFGMFYASGLQIRHDPAHLYDVAVQHETLESVTGHLDYHYLPFPYPPFVAALFVPFTFLSFPNAYHAMLGINLILIAMTIYLQCNSLHMTREQVFCLILTASVFLPLFINVFLGQLAFLGLLLYSLFAQDVLRNRSTRAGLWVALLSYKITLLPLPMLVLLVRRSWKAFFLAATLTTLLFTISFGLIGGAGYAKVVHSMTDESLIPRMQSLNALTHYLGLSRWAFWVAAVLVVAMLLRVAARAVEPRWMLACVVLANLLASPYVQAYDLSLGLLPIALAISCYSPLCDWRRTLFMLVAFLPVFLSVMGQVTGEKWPVVPITLLVLFGYCLRQAIKTPSSEPI